LSTLRVGSAHMGAAQNQALRETVVKIYVCPSDSNAGKLMRPSQGLGNTVDFASSSYKGNSGKNNTFDWWDAPDTAASYPSGTSTALDLTERNRGPLHPLRGNLPNSGTGAPGGWPHLKNKTEKIRDILDGLAYTLFVGEFATRDNVNWMAFWAYGGHHVLSGTFNASNFMLPSIDDCRGTTPPRGCARSWGSFHGGGGAINFAMCDGSVRAISTSVNMVNFHGMGSIAGDETTSD
jgi:prepilin-type processing-associated H-X9-DG protein